MRNNFYKKPLPSFLSHCLCQRVKSKYNSPALRSMVYRLLLPSAWFSYVYTDTQLLDFSPFKINPRYFLKEEGKVIFSSFIHKYYETRFPRRVRPGISSNFSDANIHKGASPQKMKTRPNYRNPTQNKRERIYSVIILNSQILYIFNVESLILIKYVGAKRTNIEMSICPR